MRNVELKGLDGTVKGEVELPSTIFDVKPSTSAMYEVCKAHLANRRRGTASTKTRAEVRGGGKKPWRQKGTGRARVGSIRSPIWVGGGVAFGPRPRDYGYKVPKRVRRLALKSALSSRADDGKLCLVEDFSWPEPKTKQMVNLLSSLGLKGKKTLLLLPSLDENVIKSGSNLPYLTIMLAKDLNCYEILASEYLLVSEGALAQVKEVWGESSIDHSETDHN
jgi:large subunit ribosomal protein L4